MCIRDSLGIVRGPYRLDFSLRCFNQLPACSSHMNCFQPANGLDSDLTHDDQFGNNYLRIQHLLSKMMTDLGREKGLIGMLCRYFLISSFSSTNADIL